MLRNSRNVIMFSGGVDSLIAWFFLDRPKCVYVDLHLPDSQKELEGVRYFSQKFHMDCEIISFSPTNDHPLSPTLADPFIPSRNLLFAILGSWFGEKVCIAGVRGDLVEDKNPEAFELMSEVITRFSRKRVKVFSPFWEMTKSDIVEWYLENVGDREALHRTVSCYHPTLHQCGNCGSCFRKWVSFRVNGVEPAFEVSQEIKSQYRDRAASGYYDQRRNREILQAIEVVHD